MLSPEEVVENVNLSKYSNAHLWRSVPTCFPSKGLYWPDTLSKNEYDFAMALADITGEVEVNNPKKDRWYEYGDNEKLEFCFDAVNIPPSRFTNGTFPVWYGASDQEASKAEVIYHLRRQAALELEHAKLEISITFERAMCESRVALDRAADIRPVFQEAHTGVSEDGPPYPFCNLLGQSARAKGADGLITISKRKAPSETWAIFKKSAILNSIVKNYWDVVVTNEAKVFVCGVETLP